ncbi:DUF2119 domain-containing protein [Methanothermobacter sp.]|uniref:DUF2119 domain-containing protein n=1 Tax=Methanothermobacter sp. TaxID=1884223 RepID=UPI002616AAE8|nr:DUF2119 domain-containing protein [Methanothermobacter sp.]MDI9614699.1 DUF2119 domain-containing protein [Methanothermobacter sp.]
MGFFRMIDKGRGPVRLFVGGVHGKEGLTAIRALRKLGFNDIRRGKLIIYSCNPTEYMSTLDPNYYRSQQGMEIIGLIEKYQPSTYLEAHCYREESYSRLTDPSRRSMDGVPPLIELEKGVLIGSVSPHIRKKLFRREDICLTIEMPCLRGPEDEVDGLEVYVNFLKTVASSETREELEERLSRKYPEQVETARRYAREFFGEYPPF